MKQALFFILFLLPLLLSPSYSYAAQFYSEDTISIDKNDQTLVDPYVFGGTVSIKQPIENDLIVAGGTITIDGDISGSAIVAGGNITLNAAVGNTARIAGGNVVINGSVARDVIIFGGSTTIGKQASISGDLIYNGGQIRITAPVTGNVVVNAGEVFIDSTVGSVSGTIDKLILGSNAVITGNLTYTSENNVQKNSGAKIQGKENYHKIIKQNTTKEDVVRAFAFGSLYKLIADILFGLLFVFFLHKFTQQACVTMKEKPWKSISSGFGFLMLGPLVSMLLLLLIFPGIAAFLLYALVLIISIVIGKVFVGWLVLYWWEKRSMKDYVLDWKAAVIGPIIMFALSYIPIIGWIIIIVIYFLTIGGIIQSALLMKESKLPQAIKNS